MVAVGCSGDATPSNAKAAPGSTTYANGKATIDGGAYYPVKGGKTSVYFVNEDAEKGGYTFGRTPTANEIAAWDKDVTPSSPPPPGSGSVEEGEELYEEQCVMCHGDFGSGGGGYPALSKGNAVEGQKSLKNQRTNPDNDGPIRVFGTYWPQASTLWWYIQAGMPHPNTKSLTDDETYALTAYILNINEFEIDGEEVDDEYVLDQEKFMKIQMPNKDGFVPNIEGPNALEDVRTFYANPANYGAQKVNPADRCMKDCQKESAKVVRIAEGGGIKDFLPPISVVRDLPKEEGAFDPKAAYEANCAMCHSGYLSPGDAAWASYTAKGIDKVYANGINGTDGGMPAKGGSNLSDADFKSVVDYLISGK
jgi:cytochrome c5